MTRFELMERIDRKIRQHKPRAKDRQLLRYLTTKQIQKELKDEKRKASAFYPLFALYDLLGQYRDRGRTHPDV
jgi:hypothetical protein